LEIEVGQSETAAAPGRRPWLVILALMLAQLAAADGITGIYSMLPTIYREFSQDTSSVSWIVSAYFLVGSVSAALCGRLADLMGRRRLAIMTLVFSTFGAFGGALATSVSGLIISAMCLGSMMCLTPILIGLAREHLSADHTALGVGAIAAAGTAGSGVVYLAVGAVVDLFGRQGGYVMMVALLVLAAVALALVVPAQKKAFRFSDIDFVRGILFAPALAGVMLAIDWGGRQGWSGATFVVLAASLLLLMYWAWTQWRAEAPLIDLRLMAHSQILRAMVVIFFFGVAGVQVGQMLSLLFQQPATTGIGFSFSAAMVGLAMLPINSTSTFVSPLGGYLTRRWTARVVTALGGALIVAGWLAMSVSFHDLALTLFSAFVVIVGLSLLQPGMYMLIVEATPVEHTSGAAGLSYTLFNIGFAIGAQTSLGILMADAGEGAAPNADAYHTAFLWLAAASTPMVLAVLFGAGLMRRAEAASAT